MLQYLLHPPCDWFSLSVCQQDYSKSFGLICMQMLSKIGLGHGIVITFWEDFFKGFFSIPGVLGIWGKTAYRWGTAECFCLICFRIRNNVQ